MDNKNEYFCKPTCQKVIVQMLTVMHEFEVGGEAFHKKIVAIADISPCVDMPKRRIRLDLEDGSRVFIFCTDMIMLYPPRE